MRKWYCGRDNGQLRSENYIYSSNRPMTAVEAQICKNGIQSTH